MRVERFSLKLALVGSLLSLLVPCYAFAQAPFYQGKTINVIQGREPGGTGDMRVRAVLPFLKKYIPGQPTIVTEFIPGSGGRRAANHIYQNARPDGLTLGNVGAGLVANAILGEPGVQYDLDKLIYLGSPNSASHYIFITRKDLGLDNIEKLRAHTGFRVGAQSVGHDIYINGRLFAWLLGLKEPRFVTGYSGPELDVALMGGELDGRANIADTVLTRNAEWVSKGLIQFHSIVEIPKGEKHPKFPNLPELESFTKNDQERKVLALNRSFRLTGSPYILPPGTPKEQIAILQEAMRKTFKDPEFFKEFKKLTGDDPTPLMPEAHEQAIKNVPRDAEIIGIFKKLAGAEPLPSR